jgi:hypothetical protein
MNISFANKAALVTGAGSGFRQLLISRRSGRRRAAHNYAASGRWCTSTVICDKPFSGRNME